MLCANGCKHDYQDRVYGIGHRLHNPCAKGYRCTVCDSVTLVAPTISKPAADATKSAK